MKRARGRRIEAAAAADGDSCDESPGFPAHTHTQSSAARLDLMWHYNTPFWVLSFCPGLLRAQCSNQLAITHTGTGTRTPNHHRLTRAQSGCVLWCWWWWCTVCSSLFTAAAAAVLSPPTNKQQCSVLVIDFTPNEEAVSVWLSVCLCMCM
mgnify:CR=1 FL=1